MNKKSDITLLLDRNIDISNRRIYFGNLDDSDDTAGEISWKTVESTIRCISHLENNSQSLPIDLHMSSGGGSALEMLRLIDKIQSSPCQIRFFGSGEISSAATWIMVVCDRRSLTQHTRLCIHDSPSTGVEESSVKMTDRQIAATEDADLQNTLNQIYADNTKMPIEFWTAIVKRDVWITADDALELGMIDEIVKPVKRGQHRRKRTAELNKVKDVAVLNKVIKKILKNTNSNIKTLKLNINPIMEESEAENPPPTVEL